MHLERTPDLTAEVDAFVARHGGRAGLHAVLGDLDRRLRRTWAPCLTLNRAWAWERADRRDPEWWPQGIAHQPDGPHVATTWYAKGGGVRVSVLDPRRRRYRHVTVVVPTTTGHEPLKAHAGGIAWHGSRLYVAATRAGLWVCETGDVVRSGGDYLLPVRHQLTPRTDEGDEPVRFSFVTVDDATEPPSLVVGEYGNRRQTRRIAEMPIDGGPATVVAHDVLRAQGVARVRGRVYLSSSNGPWGLGSIWSGAPGDLRQHRRALPMGPEDLSYDGRTGRLWTVTEHPRRRWVVSMRLSRFD
ncbi:MULTISPECIES: hypothetical protein [unclassified Nocardioides]|uniref:hypothetical protein n=1 Tax=unclassified Nocardioides TaxID=2615069 RepID=UPI00361EFE29